MRRRAGVGGRTEARLMRVEGKSGETPAAAVRLAAARAVLEAARAAGTVRMEPVRAARLRQLCVVRIRRVRRHRTDSHSCERRE